VAEVAETLGSSDRSDCHHSGTLDGAAGLAPRHAFTVDAKLYAPTTRPIPLLSAANGPTSMRLAAQHADGLIPNPETCKKHEPEWDSGARAAVKNPADMSVLVEQFVVVGDESNAKQGAALWRFIPKAFKSYYNVTDPARIQQRANAEIPLEQISMFQAVDLVRRRFDVRPHVGVPRLPANAHQ
jgi:alkanesulfonate monooxygenase SsuD/methylene tetrahydromethanopterin reductase-like flavin-dependent oxidoreductase (luciferase family)